MFTDTTAFSGFSVDDQAKAKEFYDKKLGLKVDEDQMGLTLHLGNGAEIFVYPKEDHKPATFTILNFIVPNIDETIDKLKAAGVNMEKYDNLPAPQDEKGVLRGLAAGQGPDIAWFTDPAGNVLAVLQNEKPKQ